MCVVAAPALAAVGGVSGAFSIASTAFSVVSALQGRAASEAAAQRQATINAQAAEYNAQVADNNRLLAEYMAADEIEVGRQAEQEHRLKVAQLVGNTKAVLAASGFDATEGDAPVLVADIAETGELEAQTIRRNARNRAAGKQFEADNFGSQAAFNRQRGEAFSQPLPTSNKLVAIAAGVGAVADKWHRYSESAAPAATPTPDLNHVWT